MQAFKTLCQLSEPLCGSFFNAAFSRYCVGTSFVISGFFISNLVSATGTVNPTTIPSTAIPKNLISNVSRITPSSPHQVLERLPPRVSSGTNSRIPNSITADQSVTQTASRASTQTRKSSENFEAILSTSAQLIDLSRTTGDPRYLGRAQSALGSLWDSPRAPIRAIVLQATIEQSRHGFDAARRSLLRAISQSKTPTLTQSSERAEQQFRHIAQAWLTLATLERVAGNYAEALNACTQVVTLQVTLYGNACLLETQSHLGQHGAAIVGLSSLLQKLEKEGGPQDPSSANQAWLWSLLGEAYERAGKELLATKAYEKSLRLQPDIYTVIAAVDLILRQTQNLEINAKKALTLLEKINETDATLIRKALVLKRLNSPQWRVIAADLTERFNQLKNRGDDPKAHAREQALLELWLNENYSEGLRYALVNLERQREGIDWLIALQVVAKQKDLKHRADILDRLKKTKLVDSRLEFANV
jgi:tetratricopeptide (TPR) repeat protein